MTTLPRGSRSSSTPRPTPSTRPSPSGRRSPGGGPPSAGARTASSSRCCRRQGRRTSRCRPSTARRASTSTSTPPTARRPSSGRASLGATTAWTYHDVEVMRSPGGFVFCQTLVDGAPALARDGSTILDQVCLDIPPVVVGRGGRLLARPDRPRAAGRRRRPASPGWSRRTSRGSCSSASTTRRTGAGAPRPGHRRPRGRHAVTCASARASSACTTTGPCSTAPGGQVYCLTDRDPRPARSVSSPSRPAAGRGDRPGRAPGQRELRQPLRHGPMLLQRQRPQPTRRPLPHTAHRRATRPAPLPPARRRRTSRAGRAGRRCHRAADLVEVLGGQRESQRGGVVLVEDDAGQLGVVGPGAPVEVVRADAGPHVVDRRTPWRGRRPACRRGSRCRTPPPGRARPRSASRRARCAPEQLGGRDSRPVDVREERDDHDQPQLGVLAQRRQERVGDVVRPRSTGPRRRPAAAPGRWPWCSRGPRSARRRGRTGSRGRAAGSGRSAAAARVCDPADGRRRRLRGQRVRAGVEPAQPVGPLAQRAAAQRRRVLPPLAEDGLDRRAPPGPGRGPGRRATAGGRRTRPRAAGTAGRRGARRRRAGCGRGRCRRSHATSRDGSSRWRITTNFWWCEPPARTRMSRSTSAPRRWSRSPRWRFSAAKKPVWSRCERHTRPRTSTPRSSADPSTSSTSLPGSPVSRSSASPCQSVKRTRSPGSVASQPRRRGPRSTPSRAPAG